MISPAISYTLDGRRMEGTTHPEHLALEVSLDSRLTEGASCLEPLEQLVFSSPLAARFVEGVAVKVLERKPVIQPVQDSTPDGQPMEGTTYLEHPALGVSLEVDSGKGCHVRKQSSNQCSERGRSCDQKRLICQSAITNRHVLNCRRGRRRLLI